MPFLSRNQQRQSTEGLSKTFILKTSMPLKYNDSNMN